MWLWQPVPIVAVDPPTAIVQLAGTASILEANLTMVAPIYPVLVQLASGPSVLTTLVGVRLPPETFETFEAAYRHLTFEAVEE